MVCDPSSPFNHLSDTQRLFNFPDGRELISFQATYSLCGNKISNWLLLILALPSRSFMKMVSSCFLVKHLKLTVMPILLSDPLSPLNVLHFLQCFISLDFQLHPHSSHSSPSIAPLFHFPLQAWHLQLNHLFQKWHWAAWNQIWKRSDLAFSFDMWKSVNSDH